MHAHVGTRAIEKGRVTRAPGLYFDFLQRRCEYLLPSSCPTTVIQPLRSAPGPSAFSHRCSRVGSCHAGVIVSKLYKRV